MQTRWGKETHGVVHVNIASNMHVETRANLVVTAPQILTLYVYWSYQRNLLSKGKGKAVALQTWTGPLCSSRLRLPDF
jgi:hypothetical protein